MGKSSFLICNSFSDINECDDPALNNCAATATCENTIGSFDCGCGDGFFGDGVICEGKTVFVSGLRQTLYHHLHHCFKANEVLT